MRPSRRFFFSTRFGAAASRAASDSQLLFIQGHVREFTFTRPLKRGDELSESRKYRRSIARPHRTRERAMSVLRVTGTPMLLQTGHKNRGKVAHRSIISIAHKCSLFQFNLILIIPDIINYCTYDDIDCPIN